MPSSGRRRPARTFDRSLHALAFLLLLTGAAHAVRVAADTPADAASAIPLKLPPDRIYADSVGADSAVIFSHVTHVDYESRRCTNCHPKLFRILGPSPRVTHADMNAGRSCGQCHDGKHSFDVRDNESCGSCHAGSRSRAAVAPDSAGAAPPTSSLPQAFAYKRTEASPGQVMFRHSTHRGEGMGCTSCHPKLFPKKGPATAPGGEMHETSRCGACHDGKQSFGVEDDQACARCHVEGKSR